MNARDVPWEDVSPEVAVLFAVLYADVFNFAPELKELPRYIPLKKMSSDYMETTVSALCEKGTLERSGEYVTLKGRSELVQYRYERKAKQKELWKHVDEFLPELISHNWIRGAYITGSLAAGNADPQADVDLFVILSRRRSWVGYYYLRWVKKRNPTLQFCANYIISADELSLLDPNLYTAIEWAMSVPVKGGDLLRTFETANSWVREWIPNVGGVEDRQYELGKPKSRACGTDFLINSILGGCLDFLLYHWVRFRSGGRYVPRRGTFKPHPPMRQRSVIEQVLKRMDDLKMSWPEVRGHLAACMVELDHASRAWDTPEEQERSRIASIRGSAESTQDGG